MKVVAILQARMKSSRLPGKMLMPLAGAPLVQRVIERVSRATKLDFVVLAYPLADHPFFMPVLKSFRDSPGVPLGSYAFQGDENDLVERYLGAARAYDADLIVRVPCDNPVVDSAYIDEAVRQYSLFPYPYYSNTTAAVSRGTFENETFQNIFVDGIGCEVFSISRLKWLDDYTTAYPVEGAREHPHKRFDGAAFGGFTLPPAHIRLDVNSQQDYDFIADIYNALYPTNPQFGIQEILAYLERKYWAIFPDKKVPA
jgi:spore coat polysaccharide biosynthesis protein SpsF